MKRICSLALTMALVVSASATNTNAGDFFRDLLTTESNGVRLVVSAEYISATRDSNLGRLILGPDAGAIASPEFDWLDGVRTQLGFETQQYRVLATFTNYGQWIARANRQMTAGLVFDDGAGTSWPATANSIAPNGYFSSLGLASSLPIGEADEHDGLGSNVAFADANPQFQNQYLSTLQDFELNVLNNDPTGEIRIGVGFRNLTLDEINRVTISGRYRATDIAGPTGGISNASLLSTGLQFISGTADGFEDESALGNNGVADQLTLDYRGDTDNRLNGFQVIADTCIFDNGVFDLTTFLKAGAYHNSAIGRVTETYTGVGDDTSQYGITVEDRKDSVAFVGGLAAQAGYQISQNVQFVFGYEATFITGVALAPEQAAGLRAGQYQIQTDGSLIVHGGTVGLEVVY